MESDKQLIARVVEGDDRIAFRVLVERHQGAIRNVLRRLTHGDDGLADDLAQAALIRAYLTLDGFEGKSEFRTWLYRIACNEYFLQRRSGRAKQTVSIDDAGQRAIAEAVADGNHDHGMMRVDLERAMQRFNPPEREAIVLCFYADLSHAEAAAMLHCPLGTLKSNILRGKVKLQQALAAWAPNKPEACNE